MKRFREWQLEDKDLAEDEKLRHVIESNKVRAEAVHEREAKEMAEAAYKTIKTL